MSKFTDLRTRVSETRAGKDATSSKLAIAREQLKDLQQQIAALRRTASRVDLGRIAELERQASDLSAQIGGLQGKVRDLRSDQIGFLGELAGLADPTEQIAELDDGFPILLFPVRLEIRFHRPDAGNRSLAAEAGPQLWIRIYPDDCQVDSFEELLSKSELANVQSFWVSMWRAAGVEAQERGAWRSLLGGSGSGRAAYLIQQFQPVNPADRPSKIEPQDVVLVVVPQIDVTAAEQNAAFTYYTTIWKANGDEARENAALGALRAAVGAARADEIRSKFAPDPNGQDPPKPYTRDQVRVTCTVLKLPPLPIAKQTSWTEAPKAFAQPDRFVALLSNGGVEVKRAFGNPIPDGLATGPDPSLPPAEQIRRDGDDLALNDDLKWVSDFDRAVSVGMGITVDLTAAEANSGFDRLVVLGVRFSSDESEGKQQLETLIAHHYASKHGFSLTPQGSPTNNTESGAAAHSWVDDPDASYDIIFKGKEAYPETDDPFLRRDGQWLAEALGIDDAVLKVIPNAAGSDQREARAINSALWQATLGYALEEMLTPVFSRPDIAATRLFFTRYVSGRGPIPSVRVGQQPYGILPAMAFSRYRAGGDPRIGILAGSSYPQRLHTLLARMENDWRNMSAGVAHVGQAGDPHQTLLDIVGLNSGSVEYHQRYAESFDQLYNKLIMELGPFWGTTLSLWLLQRGRTLLAQLGGDPNAAAPILQKFFYGESPLLTGPVVDDSPLSETKPIRAYTPDKRNYIEWLATSSLDTIRRQDFGANPEPNALLYLFLRHSMMLGHWDAGIRFLENRALIDTAVARQEPAFVHVQSAPDSGLSKFAHLYAAQPAITGDPNTSLAEYVLLPSVLNSAAETVDLREVIGVLDVLKGTPTARLERLFAEHIDCCTYRLDAWKTALATLRLQEMRSQENEGAKPGVYLGAFGWLENLRPKPDTLSPVRLDAGLAAVFERPKDAPLKHDPANGGYIHAPSLNHAAAAAILKNAYRVNASPSNPDAMAVNLTSDRVRQALAVLEGIRNGQTLAALLGYRFERGLHDAHSLAEVDKFIYPLRQVFPLAANKLKNTKDDTADITLLEARNVIDGMKLLAQIAASHQSTYPFGLPLGFGAGQLPAASGVEQVAINAEVDAMSNLYDAVADLVTAESVYQVVLGNFDRAAANTTAFTKGGHPPETQVVETPRTGLSITHRVALHLDVNANPAVSPNAVPMTPRARAEAPLNLWLAGRIPDPADVVVRVTCNTPALAAPKTVTVTLEKLGLQPIDVLYLMNLDLEQAVAELDDRIVQVVRYGPDQHPAMEITIEYVEAVAGKVTVFELAALVRSLRALVLKSRPVGPTDMALPLESQSSEAVWDDGEFQTRVNAAIAALTARRNALAALEADASDLDAYARKVSDEFLSTALFGAPQTGTGQIHGDMRAIYQAISAKVQLFVTRWDKKAADYAALIATFPGLATDEEKYALLRKAEGIIASTTTATPPATPNLYKAAIDITKGDFDARLLQLKGLLALAGTKLVDFVAAANAIVPLLAQHDAIPFDIADQQAAVVPLRDSLVARVTSLANDLTQRVTDAAAAVTAAADLTTSQARVQQLQAAARIVLGDEALLVSRFVLPDDRGLEFGNAFADSGLLLTDLQAGGRRFPVDDWLYGLARVRDKLSAWENVTILSEAFGATSASLTPVQLPYTANDRWLALEFDSATTSSNNRLLYSAHFATPFNRAATQCGLLLDEWPELVPATDVTSGVTFHFDRPGSQPPQSMLLAVPSALTGRWRWDDLVAALNETLDGAKMRGVEPAGVDASNYAQFLPATLMAVTLYQITIATNLAMNNHIYERIES
jgi:hypothetical protein